MVVKEEKRETGQENEDAGIDVRGVVMTAFFVQSGRSITRGTWADSGSRETVSWRLETGD